MTLGWRLRRELDDGSAGIWLYELAGFRPGPAVALLAGVHGDEFEPIRSAGAIVELPALEAGVLRVVTVCHEAALGAASRRVAGRRRRPCALVPRRPVRRPHRAARLTPLRFRARAVRSARRPPQCRPALRDATARRLEARRLKALGARAGGRLRLRGAVRLGARPVWSRPHSDGDDGGGQACGLRGMLRRPDDR